MYIARGAKFRFPWKVGGKIETPGKMTRRRLRLTCSSDEEDDAGHHHHQQQPPSQPQGREEQEQYTHVDDIRIEELHVNHEPVMFTSPYPNHIPSEPLDISDDEFIDVSDNLSPPSPPAPPSNQSFHSPLPPETVTSIGSGNRSDSTIEEFLRRVGLKLRREWLDSCIGGLESSVPGFASLDVAGKAKLCFEQFLYSDMNYSGGGILPENVSGMDLVDLPGPFVLQVDEIVNISCALRGRYQNAHSGMKRCLELSMTDGVQRVFGMEYRPIKDLEVLAPAGLKVVLCNVNVRHGLLMLVPEVIEILGGVVEELEAARQRLVQEVNKPPRGKRTRTGTVPPLATRATLAAWPSNGFSGLGNTNGSVSQNSTSFDADDHRAPLAASYIDTSEPIREERTAPIIRDRAEPIQSTNAVLGVEDVHMLNENAELNHSANAVLEDAYMVDEDEHPLMLTGDKEIPFTYLASMSAKWAATMESRSSVQGKIKCFLTGVKGFNFKQRTTFELRVYVDDGSLISEILIDHNVVQKGIGHSPEEVTAALKSSDAKTVSDMKETMKQYQMFLVHFEGTMLVEITGASTIPVALEMTQGCSASDAWLLLRRLQSFTSAQTPRYRSLDPIDISP